MAAPASFALLDSAAGAAAVLHPLRRRVLEALRQPDSATGVARRLRLPRQRVNYHVHELARAGLLECAGRRRKRNMVEQIYVARAQGYVLSPELLGALGLDPAQAGDAFSAGYLLALASQVQLEVGRASRVAAAAGKRLATLSVSTELRFESAEQRAAFTEALQQAMNHLVARHASPAHKPDGTAAPGRLYRLVLGCYPIPSKTASGGGH